MHGVRSDAPYLDPKDKDALLAGRYRREFYIIREMGWSWSELVEAPFDFVQEVFVRLSAENHWRQVKREQDKAELAAGKRNV